MSSELDRIFEACEATGLMVDRLKPPIKIGGDCYLVHAVAKTDACHRWGACEQRPYYAITGGKDVLIVNTHGDTNIS